MLKKLPDHFKGGGGGGGLAIKEKNTFFITFFSKVSRYQRPLSSRGGGGKALMARPLREEFFLWLSLSCLVFYLQYCHYIYLSLSFEDV